MMFLRAFLGDKYHLATLLKLSLDRKDFKNDLSVMGLACCNIFKVIGNPFAAWCFTTAIWSCFFWQVAEHLWINETSWDILGEIGMFNALIECLFCTFRYYAAEISFLIWLHKSNNIFFTGRYCAYLVAMIILPRFSKREWTQLANLGRPRTLDWSSASRRMTWKEMTLPLENHRCWRKPPKMQGKKYYQRCVKIEALA